MLTTEAKSFFSIIFLNILGHFGDVDVSATASPFHQRHIFVNIIILDLVVVLYVVVVVVVDVVVVDVVVDVVFVVVVLLLILLLLLLLLTHYETKLPGIGVSIKLRSYPFYR